MVLQILKKIQISRKILNSHKMLQVWNEVDIVLNELGNMCEVKWVNCGIKWTEMGYISNDY